MHATHCHTRGRGEVFTADIGYESGDSWEDIPLKQPGRCESPMETSVDDVSSDVSTDSKAG